MQGGKANISVASSGFDHLFLSLLLPSPQARIGDPLLSLSLTSLQARRGRIQVAPASQTPEVRLAPPLGAGNRSFREDGS